MSSLLTEKKLAGQDADQGSGQDLGQTKNIGRNVVKEQDEPNRKHFSKRKRIVFKHIFKGKGRGA